MSGKLLRTTNAISTLASVLLAASMVFAHDHPLDPLSAEEIRTTRNVLQAAGKVSEATRFPLVALEEPDKRYVIPDLCTEFGLV
jgi:Cu2+-containing amine oxidase